MIAVLCPREGSGPGSPKPSPGWKEGGAWHEMLSDAGKKGWPIWGCGVSAEAAGVRALEFVSASRKGQSLEWDTGWPVVAAGEENPDDS